MITEENAKATVAEPLEHTMSRLVNSARVEAVFGQPVERGDITVIPCSEISVGLGMGSGSGPVDAQGNRAGGGSGGGGGASGRPIAAIVITKEGVRIEPIFDLTKIVLASLTTGAFILLWIGRLFLRSGKEPSYSRIRRVIGR